MIDGQFDLDGFLFGPGTDVRVDDFDLGQRVVNDQDTPVPGGPGRAMGDDVDDGPEWTFELVVKAGSGVDNFDTVEDLRTAWQAAPTARTPGSLSVLRYALPGRVRRVYGRPRRFAPVGDAVRYGWHHNRFAALATFQLADPLVYDDVEASLELRLAPSSSGVLVLPSALPWSLGRATGQRQGQVVVAGRAEVPFTVTFHGPVSGTASNLWAQGPGWRVELATTLAFDQSVTVDTRTHTVTRNDGLSLVGAARGRFLAARLSPGAQEVTFGATDPTSTARAVIAWRPGYHSI